MARALVLQLIQHRQQEEQKQLIARLLEGESQGTDSLLAGPARPHGAGVRSQIPLVLSSVEMNQAQRRDASCPSLQPHSVASLSEATQDSQAGSELPNELCSTVAGERAVQEFRDSFRFSTRAPRATSHCQVLSIESAGSQKRASERKVESLAETPVSQQANRTAGPETASEQVPLALELPPSAHDGDTPVPAAECCRCGSSPACQGTSCQSGPAHRHTCDSPTLSPAVGHSSNASSVAAGMPAMRESLFAYNAPVAGSVFDSTSLLGPARPSVSRAVRMPVSSGEAAPDRLDTSQLVGAATASSQGASCGVVHLEEHLETKKHEEGEAEQQTPRERARAAAEAEETEKDASFLSLVEALLPDKGGTREASSRASGIEELLNTQMQRQHGHERHLRRRLTALTQSLRGALSFARGESFGDLLKREELRWTQQEVSRPSMLSSLQGEAGDARLLQHHQALLQHQKQQLQRYLQRCTSARTCDQDLPCSFVSLRQATKHEERDRSIRYTWETDPETTGADNLQQQQPHQQRRVQFLLGGLKNGAASEASWSEKGSGSPRTSADARDERLLSECADTSVPTDLCSVRQWVRPHTVVGSFVTSPDSGEDKLSRVPSRLVTEVSIRAEGRSGCELAGSLGSSGLCSSVSASTWRAPQRSGGGPPANECVGFLSSAAKEPKCRHLVDNGGAPEAIRESGRCYAGYCHKTVLDKPGVQSPVFGEQPCSMHPEQPARWGESPSSSFLQRSAGAASAASGGARREAGSRAESDESPLLSRHRHMPLASTGLLHRCSPPPLSPIQAPVWSADSTVGGADKQSRASGSQGEADAFFPGGSRKRCRDGEQGRDGSYGLAPEAENDSSSQGEAASQERYRGPSSRPSSSCVGQPNLLITEKRNRLAHDPPGYPVFSSFLVNQPQVARDMPSQEFLPGGVNPSHASVPSSSFSSRVSAVGDQLGLPFHFPPSNATRVSACLFLEGEHGREGAHCQTNCRALGASRGGAVEGRVSLQRNDLRVQQPREDRAHRSVKAAETFSESLFSREAADCGGGRSKSHRFYGPKPNGSGNACRASCCSVCDL